MSTIDLSVHNVVSVTLRQTDLVVQESGVRFTVNDFTATTEDGQVVIFKLFSDKPLVIG